MITSILKRINLNIPKQFSDKLLIFSPSDRLFNKMFHNSMLYFKHLT